MIHQEGAWSVSGVRHDFFQAPPRPPVGSTVNVARVRQLVRHHRWRPRRLPQPPASLAQYCPCSRASGQRSSRQGCSEHLPWIGASWIRVQKKAARPLTDGKHLGPPRAVRRCRGPSTSPLCLLPCPSQPAEPPATREPRLPTMPASARTFR